MASTRNNSGAKLQEAKFLEDVNPKDSSHGVADLEAGPVDQKLESESDINEVNWESDDDPANPVNWGTSRKWRNLGVISIMSLTTSVKSFFPSIIP
jgi:hypothetical protein